MLDTKDVRPDLIERLRCVGGSIDLHDMPTAVDPLYDSTKHYRQLLRTDQWRLRKLQRQLFVGRKQALVIILQGLDTAGKDGIIRHVLGAFNAQGCRVYSFGVPTAEEIGHDILWRTARFLPERGFVSVFNRSHYEEVLVARVHPEFLAPQKIDPASIEDGSVWRTRYESILAHERHLLESGTRIVKLMLHVSAEEQARRLLSRLDDPTKNWKFDESDLEERRFRDRYLEVYSACLSATSTPEAPWYVVPADDKRSSRLIAAGILKAVLESMDLGQPEVSDERAAELAKMRDKLTGS